MIYSRPPERNFFSSLEPDWLRKQNALHFDIFSSKFSLSPNLRYAIFLFSASVFCSNSVPIQNVVAYRGATTIDLRGNGSTRHNVEATLLHKNRARKVGILAFGPNPFWNDSRGARAGFCLLVAGQAALCTGGSGQEKNCGAKNF